MMKYLKSYLRDLATPEGWKWVYYEDDLYYFQKGTDKTGYISRGVLDSDIESLDYMEILKDYESHCIFKN